MSTKISAIYDDLHQVIQTLLPEHKELINPYFPEDNDNLTFDKAWGLTVLEASNTKKDFCHLSVARNFEFLLTRKIFMGNLRTEGSKNKRHIEEKALFEDQIVVAKYLQSNTYLKNSGFTNAAKLFLNSDSGLNFVRDGDTGLIILRSILEFEYFEELNI